jgi:hypothetical protein
VAQPLKQPALRITIGKVIAAGCLNCRSPLEWQFAMYSLEKLRFSHRQFADTEAHSVGCVMFVWFVDILVNGGAALAVGLVC